MRAENAVTTTPAKPNRFFCLPLSLHHTTLPVHDVAPKE
jgi:hypothetical protein